MKKFIIFAILIIGILWGYKMINTVKPGNDFYDYVTLDWRKKNPLPDDYSRYGIFDYLRDIVLNQTQDIIKSDNGKIGLLYKIAMDEKKLNDNGIVPVKQYFVMIDNIKSKSELPKLLGELHKFSGGFWSDSVEPDEKNSKFYLYNMGQGGTTLSRDYFFDDDEKTREIRAKYLIFINDILKHFNIDGDANKIYDLQKQLANSHYKKELLRDPDANYHKTNIVDMAKKLKGFNWTEYFNARGIKTNALNLRQPEPIETAIKIINNSDLDLIKSYLKFNIAIGSCEYLDDATYDLCFDFFNRTMGGQKKPKPRWKRAVSMVDSALGEEISSEYVKKYFPEDAKKRMEHLVENLRNAYKIRIEKLDWMSEKTRERALEKLAGFRAKIGYPNKFRDYTNLEIKNDSLLQNMIRSSEFEDAYWLAKIDQPIDPENWYMFAHTVNAYYDPSSNEICFPAGILQSPFFDMNADDAVNYGAIGSVIAHEMTHGFDDQGRKFDKDGNLKNWWTDADIVQFDKRAKVMEDYFNNIEVFPGIFANGKFTLGENLADYGGVLIAFTAYENFGNGKNYRDFFTAYAMTEAGNITDEKAQEFTKTDVHSLSRWRVNGILPHIDAWYDAFDINENDAMYIPPAQRVKLW